MRVGSGEYAYEWIDNWAKIPDSETRRDGWAHHGVVYSPQRQQIIAFHPGEPNLLFFTPDGVLVQSLETNLTEGHGLTLVEEDGEELLWVADTGAKRVKDANYQYVSLNKGWQLLKLTLAGEIVGVLGPPNHPVYHQGTFTPTWVAVNEKRCGGNGDVWVADGYGSSYVHRYRESGEYVSSINGEEGATGRFSCPHSIWVDTRKSEPELYVADRANGRIQVYDLDGKYKRSFGTGLLTSPSGFAGCGDTLFVIELRARLAIFDPKDQLVEFIGANEEVCRVDGWPNYRIGNGTVERTPLLETGKFNSPHGVAADSDGNVYVSEWLIGGRYTKLEKAG
jgi:sugar lactone lactonase YvrE